MINLKQTFAVVFFSLFAVSGFAADKPPVKATEKPQVLKPCKPGQTEKDGCKEVKKVEKKAPEKKAPAKKVPEKAAPKK